MTESSDPTSDLQATWHIHARIQTYVLDAVEPSALVARGLKGRTVGHQFAHLHDVRRMWLEPSAPDLLHGVIKLGTGHSDDKSALVDALSASAAAIRILVGRAEAGARIQGFKLGASAFVGYLIAHESYHQGDIGVRLTELGMPLSRAVASGMWEWSAR